MGGQVGVVGGEADLGFEAFDLLAEGDALAGDGADSVAVVAVGAGERPGFATARDAGGFDGDGEWFVAVVTGGVAGGGLHGFLRCGNPVDGIIAQEGGGHEARPYWDGGVMR